MPRGEGKFLIKQRAFLKLYMIRFVEEHKMYGMQAMDELKTSFKPLGYEPNHSEIYRSLHDLIDDGILMRTKKVQEGAKYKEIVVYQFADYEKAKLYKKQVKTDLDRSMSLLRKALEDVY
ncbi:MULTISPECIES: helix-turn-helix transcriptional regulator [Bacillaceae]|uniref:Replication termination protein n=1 Tax=Domibacillus aminovorans TaxID=29332 RepID=A0A177KIZ2_9BACI|nr:MULTISPECIES: helix-turn-helix transcriptional regulator [Bacillaceae]OAH52845.1 Replication termination protein [Domibacillus aminovorans]OAH60773.1 Replication termination protein [Domibacillus aminovorans]